MIFKNLTGIDGLDRINPRFLKAGSALFFAKTICKVFASRIKSNEMDNSILLPSN